MEVFADEGITGTSTSKRKNFLRMIRQCRQGKIDLILTKSISRFARNTVDTLNYTRELRNLGIPVIFEEHGLNSIYPESEFLITIFGAQAQAESESTSSRVRWGVQQSMRDGRASIQYKYLLGYRKGADGQMEIVPEEAETVRQIYRMYLAGQPLRNIRTSLVSEGRRNALGTTEWTHQQSPNHPDGREVLRRCAAAENLHSGLHQQEGDTEYGTVAQIPHSESSRRHHRPCTV